MGDRFPPFSLILRSSFHSTSQRYPFSFPLPSNFRITLSFPSRKFPPLVIGSANHTCEHAQAAQYAAPTLNTHYDELNNTPTQPNSDGVTEGQRRRYRWASVCRKISWNNVGVVLANGRPLIGPITASCLRGTSLALCWPVLRHARSLQKRVFDSNSPPFPFPNYVMSVSFPRDSHGKNMGLGMHTSSLKALRLTRMPMTLNIFHS